jgi:Reverse transcriptase (RNA-dependent DNA polymerase)
VRAYIDDLLIITKGTFEDHIDSLEVVFNRLKQAGLKVNAKKSFFMKSEQEYLGYWISKQGVSPTTKKVNAITNIATPTNKKEL